MVDMTPPAASSIEARERLLTAAQSLYAENGVAATTPREVLERSHVGQGSLYHHFPSKAQLARAAVERTSSEQLTVAAGVLGSDTAPADRIRAYLLRERDAVSGCRVGRLTADRLVMSTPDLQEPVAGYFTGLLTLAHEAFREAGLDTVRARERAAAVVAIVQGGYVLARATGDAGIMRDAVRGMVALLETAARDE